MGAPADSFPRLQVFSPLLPLKPELSGRDLGGLSCLLAPKLDANLHPIITTCIMSNDFVLVEPKAWEYDLHSIYSAYIGYFTVYNIPWYERSWGNFFESFDEFLGFSWPVITVTDTWTGKAHITTRLTAITNFIKMIKTRFGETLPQAPNILQITPFETGQRRLRHVSDYVTYSRLHATLPAAHLAAVKTRVRSGEPKVIRELWEKRDRTFLAIDFEWNERNEHTVLEWGYAALRCGHFEALGHWPPAPDINYRKGHYVVSEYVDKIVNKHCPTFPWQYAFGDSQVASKLKLPQIIQTIISSLASPDSETAINTLVLVAHGMQGILARLEEMKIKLPSNMLILDTAVLERAMHTSGQRSAMMDPKTEKLRASGTTLSLEQLLISFTLPPLSPSLQSDFSGNQVQTAAPILLPQCTMHNAGNDAFMTLFAFQQLMEPFQTKTPMVVKKHAHAYAPRPRLTSHTSTGWPMVSMASPGLVSPPMSMLPAGSSSSSSSIPSSLMVPAFSNFGGLQQNLAGGGGVMSMPSGGNAMTIPMTMGRPNSAALYDLASEFGNLHVLPRPGSSGQLREGGKDNHVQKRLGSFA